jgi:hypothetical protein
MRQLFNPARWRNLRNSYLKAARDCRRTLTDPQGHWRYAVDDPQVKKAVGFWVQRARRAHAIALGREPITENAVVIQDGQGIRGPLYVGAA